MNKEKYLEKIFNKRKRTLEKGPIDLIQQLEELEARHKLAGTRISLKSRYWYIMSESSVDQAIKEIRQNRWGPWCISSIRLQRLFYRSEPQTMDGKNYQIRGWNLGIRAMMAKVLDPADPEYGVESYEKDFLALLMHSQDYYFNLPEDYHANSLYTFADKSITDEKVQAEAMQILCHFRHIKSSITSLECLIKNLDDYRSYFKNIDIDRWIAYKKSHCI